MLSCKTRKSLDVLLDAAENQYRHKTDYLSNAANDIDLDLWNDDKHPFAENKRPAEKKTLNEVKDSNEDSLQKISFLEYNKFFGNFQLF